MDAHTCNAYCIPSDQIHCSAVYISPQDPSTDCVLTAEDIIALAPATEAPSWGRYLAERYHIPVVERSEDPQPFLMYWRHE